MRASIFQVLAMAVVALAQTSGFDTITSPPDQASYKVGDTLPIAWTPTAPAGTVTLTLIGGPSRSDLSPIIIIAASLDSTAATFNWPIPPTVGSFSSYGINLTIDTSTNFQYSNQFYITGGSSSSSSASASGSGATTTLTSTTQSTATLTVSSTNSTLATPTPSGNVLNSTSLTSASPSKTSSTTSATGGGSASGSSSSSSASPTATKNAAGAVNVGSVALVGLGGALMAALL